MKKVWDFIKVDPNNIELYLMLGPPLALFLLFAGTLIYYIGLWSLLKFVGTLVGIIIAVIYLGKAFDAYLDYLDRRDKW